LSLTGIFALFCLFMTLHGIIHSIGILVGAVSSFFFPVFGLLIICVLSYSSSAFSIHCSYSSWQRNNER
jgi:hypothetical protein